LAQHKLLDAAAVAHAAAQESLEARDLPALATALAAALTLCDTTPPELSRLVVCAVEAAEVAGKVPASLPAAVIEPSLEVRAAAGDRVAAYALGRALCGIALGDVPSHAIAVGQNMRKGAALLLRAADAGCDEAWLHLYRIHSDNRLSVGNPQMARFFLEKAAMRGIAEAQRRLGALVLRGASTLDESEQAMSWLHQAARQGDGHAHQLLRSLVLPLEGEDEDAETAIAAVARHDPRLAARLRVSREFGLTKLEALCFDPVSGLRPWGLVVGKNPFISQIRLSAPRAVPALTREALEHLRSVAQFFARAGADAGRYEGDLRRRSLNQRRLFARLGLDEAMFFSVATSVALDSFRLGTKWAFRARQPLRMALAE
jgi:TPR repeat protein